MTDEEMVEVFILTQGLRCPSGQSLREIAMERIGVEITNVRITQDQHYLSIAPNTPL